MIVSIDLKYLLGKNKMTLKNFIDKHNLNTYQELLSHCKNRGIKPIDKSEYVDIVSERNVKKNYVKKTKAQKPTADQAPVKRKTTRRARKASKS